MESGEVARLATAADLMLKGETAVRQSRLAEFVKGASKNGPFGMKLGV